MRAMNRSEASQRASFDARSKAARVRSRLRAGSERGQSLVEFAVSLPLLLVVLTGIFTFGFAFNNYLMLTDAVAVGGRQLAISRGQTTDPCATAANVVYGVAPFLTKSSLGFTFVLNGATYTGATCSSSSTTTGAAGNLVQGGTAKITVTYPCKLSVFGANYAPGCTLTSQNTEVVQ